MSFSCIGNTNNYIMIDNKNDNNTVQNRTKMEINAQ